MARRTAVYDVIRDGDFTLNADGSQGFNFPGIEAVDRNERGLVSFLATPLDPKVGLEVEINGANLRTFDLSGKDILRGVWEAFDPNGVVLHADEENRVTFHATGGRVSISDVILWVKRNVEV